MIVGAGEGAAAGLLVFSVEAGEGGYQYLKHDIYKPAFERKVMDAAVKRAIGTWRTAVAIFIGATPGGWVVLAIGVGGYCITDIALSQWHEQQNRQHLTRDDLAQYGIEINSVLDMKTDDASLNIGGH